jgi:small subunit ribosomal protein S6
MKGADMALYEHIFIARPDISPAQMESLIEETKALIEEKGGKTGKTEYWGLRNLAYRINKSRKGHYGLIDMDAPADVVAELDRIQRLSEDVIRHMTVRVEDHSEEPSAILSKKDDRRGRRPGGCLCDRQRQRTGPDRDLRLCRGHRCRYRQGR